jgi:hypothetical protein
LFSMNIEYAHAAQAVYRTFSQIPSFFAPVPF